MRGVSASWATYVRTDETLPHAACIYLLRLPTTGDYFKVQSPDPRHVTPVAVATFWDDGCTDVSF